MNKNQKGEILEPVLILIGLMIVIFIFVLPTGPRAPKDTRSNSGPAWTSDSSGTNRDSKRGNSNSLYEIDVDLGKGNASSKSDAVEEYVTLTNRGDAPLNISGWFLTNAKGSKPYSLNGQLVYSPSDHATIAKGTTRLSPNGLNVLTDIILGPNEKAILITGSIGPRSNIPIVSFKVNKCSGYLEKDAEYTFVPPLRKNCPRPSEEPGFQYLDEKCQDFIEGMSSCHIPDFDTRNIQGESCRNCVDGRPGLSSSCITFLKTHYNYAGCMTYHGQDSDFLGKEWRIFLDQKWEMWAEKKETISLFDQFGKLIDYLAY